MAKLLAWLEGKLGGGPDGGKRVRTFRWLIVLGLAGAFLMVLNSFISVKTIDPGTPVNPPEQQAFIGSQTKPESPFAEYEQQYELRLREILEKIVGVGNVDVLVTIDSTEEKVVYQNARESEQITNERDSNGATRHITDVSREGEIVLHEVSGGQDPIVTKTIRPNLRGVIIVANGAENTVVKKMLFEAVQKGLNVPPSRISILPRKQQ